MASRRVPDDGLAVSCGLAIFLDCKASEAGCQFMHAAGFFSDSQKKEWKLKNG